jgi:hypothetical protein
MVGALRITNFTGDRDTRHLENPFRGFLFSALGPSSVPIRTGTLDVQDMSSGYEMMCRAGANNRRGEKQKKHPWDN